MGLIDFLIEPPSELQVNRLMLSADCPAIELFAWIPTVWPPAARAPPPSDESAHNGQGDTSQLGFIIILLNTHVENQDKDVK